MITSKDKFVVLDETEIKNLIIALEKLGNKGKSSKDFYEKFNELKITNIYNQLKEVEKENYED